MKILEIFTEGNARLSQISHKMVKKTHLFGHLKFKTKNHNYNRDNRKTLFNHCLLHVIGLHG